MKFEQVPYPTTVNVEMTFEEVQFMKAVIGEMTGRIQDRIIKIAGLEGKMTITDVQNMYEALYEAIEANRPDMLRVIPTLDVYAGD